MTSRNRCQQFLPGAHLPLHSTQDRRIAFQAGPVRLHPPPLAHQQDSEKPPLLSLRVQPSSLGTALANTQSTLPPLLASQLPFPSQASNADLRVFLPSSNQKWTKRDSNGSSSSRSAGVPRTQKFQRVRTGCLVCRRRNVKCSQDSLPCRQCRIRNRDCHYDKSQSKQPSKRESANSSSFNAHSEGQHGLERRFPRQNASSSSNSPSDPSLCTSATPLPEFMVYPFVQSSLPRFLPPEPLGPAAATPAYVPAADSSTIVPTLATFPFHPYKPSAAAGLDAVGSIAAIPNSACIVQWQNSVLMPSGQTYPPFPSMYAHEDLQPALDPRMYLPRDG